MKSKNEIGSRHNNTIMENMENHQEFSYRDCKNPYTTSPHRKKSIGEMRRNSRGKDDKRGGARTQQQK